MYAARVGDRLHLHYPASRAYTPEDFDVIVEKVYEDGAFDVDLDPQVTEYTDWTVFPQEVSDGTVVITER